jgi:hypothetical protein
MPFPNYEIRWKNFRGFRDTGWITLKPLTVLIGPNNSGKTSLVAPLLILNQTFSSKDPATPLVTRGPLLDAGNYRDFVYGHKRGADVSFGLRFYAHEREGRLKKLEAYPPGAMELTFSSGRTPPEFVLKTITICDPFDRVYVRRSRTETGRYSATGWPFSNMRKAELRAVRAAEPVNFYFSATRLVSELQASRKHERRSLPKRFSAAFHLYLSVVDVVYYELRLLFNDLSYIGPLRQRPQRFYEVSAEAPRSVGLRGENAPNLLRNQYASIAPHLAKWAKAFGFADHVRPHSISDEVFAVQCVRDSGREVTNIADAGFGVSQVLPLIVQAHAAKRNSLTVAEQPEIHLNPRLQCTLADLFVEMVSSKQRVVVETHSEHLLLRLRRLVADRKIRAEDVAIYFVERRGLRSTIREIPIGGNGHILAAEWPTGFFGDSLRESLALATSQSRRAAQG